MTGPQQIRALEYSTERLAKKQECDEMHDSNGETSKIRHELGLRTALYLMAYVIGLALRSSASVSKSYLLPEVMWRWVSKG